MIKGLVVSEHARLRMAQRGVSMRAVELAVTWGSVRWQTGSRVLVVDDNAVAAAARRGEDITAVHGLHVVVTDGVVVTIYRNRRTPRTFARKHRSDRQRRHEPRARR